MDEFISHYQQQMSRGRDAMFFLWSQRLDVILSSCEVRIIIYK